MVSRPHSDISRGSILDFTPWLKAVVLGLVEGATEFIPVSSTGHLILVGNWLSFEGDAAVTFDIVIQLGAILAVLWIYRAKVFGALAHWKGEPSSRRFLVNLLIAFLPAAIIGFLTHDYIEEHLFSPLVVAVSMVVGGVAILVIERWHRKAVVHSVDQFTTGLALGIGLCQVLSLVPGVSRSGATIMGALALGTARIAATEFSFFLAVPTLVAAGGYDLYKNRALLSADDLGMFAVGLVAAFASAFLCVRWLLRYIASHDFTVFAWYRIVFGLVVLLTAWTGMVSWGAV